MGMRCIRCKKVEDLRLDVIAEAFRRVPAKRYVEHYQAAILTMNKAKAAAARKPAKAPPKAAPKKAKRTKKA